MSKSIPDRWLDYKPFGDVIAGTKIVAFKVPLKETVAKNLQPEQRFTTAVLMKAFPKMKYIIDLTNTARYYDQTDFTNAGIKYQKVMIPGMQVPPLECVKRFFKAMENFTAECGKDEVIGVHCTHGVNRSGYLICRFLTQQLGWSHSNALKYFHEARGYPIERATYIADLKRQPVGTKIDVSKVDLSAPMKLPKQRPNMKHLGPRPPFPPMAPPGPPMPPRRFLNGAPFPPPPGKFGPPRAPAFGPPRPPPPMPGAHPPPRGPPMFGPPRPPRGPFGPMPPPPPGPMRHHPGPMPPPGPPGMRIPGPPRPLPMGPPVPPPRPHHPGMAPRIGPPGPQRHPPPGPQRHPPPPPMRLLPPGKMAPPPPRPNTRAAKQQQQQQQQQQQVRDLDFTADVFEENLAAKPTRNARKRPYPRN